MDLSHVLAAIGSGLFGAILGLIAGIWRAGQIKETVKRELHEELDGKMDEALTTFETRLASSVDMFDETLKGLRQKINDVQLDTERRFLPRDGFEEFRKEFRHDMQTFRAEIMQALGRS